MHAVADADFLSRRSGNFCLKKCMGRRQPRDCALKNGTGLIEDSDSSN